MHPALINLEKTFGRSSLTRIDDPRLKSRRIELLLKRDDLLHPVLSGNKWRKLKYLLDHALTLGCDTMISMGGIYSNHLHALAYVGQRLGLRTIGHIRGEQTEPMSPTLQDCRNWGMELRFVSRADYRLLRQFREPFDLPGIRPKQYWLPEGGAQPVALQGVAEMVAEIDRPFDVLCLPCGSGATLAGCITALNGAKPVLGFAALKNADFLMDDVEALLPKNYTNWNINQHYHFGGFAKTTPELIEFIRTFEMTQQVPLEPIYSGKMLYGLYDMIAKNYYAPGQCIIAVHTGGLQGKRGFNNA